MPGPLMPVVRAFAIHYNNKKIGEANGVAFQVSGGRTMLYGAEGFFTLSRGAVTTGVDVDFVVPVAGMSVDVVTDIINQNDVEVIIPANGHAYGVTMGLTDGSLTSNTETGVANGKCTLKGGAPKILL